MIKKRKILSLPVIWVAIVLLLVVFLGTILVNPNVGIPLWLSWVGAITASFCMIILVRIAADNIVCVWILNLISKYHFTKYGSLLNFWANRIIRVDWSVSHIDLYL